MAQAIRQKIELEGGEEVQRQLEQIGTTGEEAFKSVKEATDQSAESYQQYQDQLQNVSSSISQVANQAEQLGGALTRGSSSAISSLATLAGSLGTVGGALAAFAVAAGAAAVAMFELSKSSAEALKDIDKLGSAAGLSADGVRSLQFILEQTGMSSEEAKSAIKTMGDQFDGAKKKAEDLAKSMGIVTSDAASLFSPAVVRGGQVFAQGLTDAQAAVLAMQTAIKKAGEDTDQTKAALTALGDVLRRLPEPKRLDLLQKIFPEGDEKLLEALLDKSGEALDKFIDRYKNRIGEIGPEASERAKEFRKALQEFQFAAEQSKINLGAMFLPMTTEALRWVNDTILAWKKAFKEGGWAAVGQEIWDELVRGLTAGLGALGEEIQRELRAIWEDLKQLDTAVWEWLKSLFSPESLNAAWETIKSAASAAWDAIKQAASDAWEAIKTLFTPEGLAAAWEAIKQAASDTWEAIKQAASDAWTWITENLVSAETLTAVWDAIKQAASDAWEAIKQGAIDFATWLVSGGWISPEALQAVWDAIKNAALATWEAIKAGAVAAWGEILQAWSAANFQPVWDALKTGAQATWDGVKAAAQAAWDGVKAVFTAENMSAAWSALTSAATTAFNGLVSAAQAAWSAVGAAANLVFSGVAPVIEAVGSAAAKAFAGIADPLRQAISEIQGILQTLADPFAPLAQSANNAEQAVSALQGSVDNLVAAVEAIDTGPIDAAASAASGLASALDSVAASASAAAAAIASIPPPPAGGGGGFDTGGGGDVIETAHGGLIRGPGTATSDSIWARVSTGEFVVQARAVSNLMRRYGPGIMGWINHGVLPLRMALGGLVGDALNRPVPRFAGGGFVPQSLGGGPASILNLAIGGETFNGLIIPSEETAARLARYTYNRQLAATGRGPGWR